MAVNCGLFEAADNSCKSASIICDLDIDEPSSCFLNCNEESACVDACIEGQSNGVDGVNGDLFVNCAEKKDVCKGLVMICPPPGDGVTCQLTCPSDPELKGCDDVVVILNGRDRDTEFICQTPDEEECPDTVRIFDPSKVPTCEDINDGDGGDGDDSDDSESGDSVDSSDSGEISDDDSSESDAADELVGKAMLNNQRFEGDDLLNDGGDGTIHYDFVIGISEWTSINMLGMLVILLMVIHCLCYFGWTSLWNGNGEKHILT